jgi:cytoskeletal protein CcmA (bactofilin family)
MIILGRKSEEPAGSAGKQLETKTTTQTPATQTPATQTPATQAPATQTPTSQSSATQSSTFQSPSVAHLSEQSGIEIKGERFSAYVGSGATFVGEATFQSMLRVDGTLTGQVKSEDGTLIVGASGRVDAGIRVGVAIINGVVSGDIFASNRVELGKTARVTGNIETPRLKIEEGALFEGKCTMLKMHEASQKDSVKQAIREPGKEPGREPIKST